MKFDEMELERLSNVYVLNNINNHLTMSVYREVDHIKELQRDPDYEENIEQIADDEMIYISCLAERWYEEFEDKSYFAQLQSYITSRGYTLERPRKFGAIKGVEGLGAYASGDLESLDDRLSVFGLPVDNDVFMNYIKDNGFSEEEAREYLVTHESIHMAIHTGGYDSLEDMAYKEGQVERMMTEYFREVADECEDLKEASKYEKMADFAEARAEGYEEMLEMDEAA